MELGALGSRFIAEGIHAAKPIDQGRQPAMVLFAHGNKFHTEASAGPVVANNGLSADLAFLNEEVKLRFGLGGELPWSLYEKAARTEVADARNVFPTFAVPVDPDVTRDFDSRIQPARRCFAQIHVILPRLAQTRA